MVNFFFVYQLWCYINFLYIYLFITVFLLLIFFSCWVHLTVLTVTNLWIGLLPIIEHIKCAGRDLKSLETVEHLKEVLGNSMVEASVDGMWFLFFLFIQWYHHSIFYAMPFFFLFLIWLLDKKFIFNIFNYLHICWHKYLNL